MDLRRMRWVGGFLLVTLLVVAPLSRVAGGERHSGIVLAVDANARTMILDEFGANAVRRALRVRLSPETRVLLSERNPAARDLERPFTTTRIRLADIRPGDFVVVSLSEAGEEGVATTVTVTLRRGSRSDG